MHKRKEIIPNNLKAFRLKAGLTQKQVAEKLGLQCEDRLSHWERGVAIPSIINLSKLCRVYNIAIEEAYPTLSKAI